MRHEASPRPVEPRALHFGDEASRQDAAHLGMWIFLATEVLLFSVLFTAYALYRLTYPGVFQQAPAHMDVFLGTLNTFVLVSSSILVALAVDAIRNGRDFAAAALLALSVLLGMAFLFIKAAEYTKHVHDGALPGAWYAYEAFALPGANLYFTLYWVMTGVHAVHVLVGVGVLVTLALRTLAGEFGARFHTPVELGGMYWHLVDVVWLFLWPLLYLT
ncbi:MULTISPECIES: cytochrome c oxidase subunit 3 [Myxococcus]|uniref:cytochrome c oxidase subunit 3 n=1 Tax=Myxococcus TaxID=32 RepID=UPI00112D8450|nr:MULTISPECIES: cytochrome c oxidase subunit 3 [Myxococcus]QDE83617.1 cytochrome C oxidase subunit III [Myxococcus xanthus]QDE97744.1 cytochrome C oxidase subunit III [Myxococcus xanthus]WAM22883.1 cytochrome c oxidase subunit 3 [Myxococcus sp. NMCA1]